MKQLIVILSLMLHTPSVSVEPINMNFKNILYKNDIDIDSKSIKGWIRLFNSREKMDRYELDLTEDEILFILATLRKEFEMKSKKFSRGVE